MVKDTQRIIEVHYDKEFIGEYWLQRYIKENPEKYGLTNIRWKNSKGESCDLAAEYEGEFCQIEVEWMPQGYLKHVGKKQFENVKILMCLDDIPVPDKIRKLLPPKIIIVRSDDFHQWYKQKTGSNSRIRFTFQNS